MHKLKIKAGYNLLHKDWKNVKAAGSRPFCLFDASCFLSSFDCVKKNPNRLSKAFAIKHILRYSIFDR